jgi:hypothetical protein
MKGQQVLSRINFENRELISASVTAADKVVELQEPTYSDLLAKISDDSMIIDESQIKGIHNGFHANTDKRFIILSGLSGTGKTKILQDYANAYCELMDLDPDEHVELVSITPAFRDHTPLLGYLNPLTNPPRYIAGELTDFLLAAEASPELPFFLILDEMNLARVEFYLAPILSGMESSTRIAFHESEDVDFPSGLKSWPSNVFMAGTVNMDETTHAFSDKVLDRAFTMEFWKIDLQQYFIQNPTVPAIQDKITQIYNILEPAHLHFGYRTVKALVDYVERAVMTDANDQMDALDQAIFSKVLPKIRGQKSTLLTSTIAALLVECSGLTQSEAKLQQMQTRLKETGLTRFWR